MTMLTSMLFVPGGDEAKLAKLDTLDAPALIVDLEDAVADSRKAAARGMVADAIAASTTEHPVWVRVNTDRPSATVADLAAVVHARLAGVVLPKVESAG
ncbi:aldolase/citrate lyase family protein, partial [Paenibacillus sp. TAF58]